MRAAFSRSVAARFHLLDAPKYDQECVEFFPVFRVPTREQDYVMEIERGIFCSRTPERMMKSSRWKLLLAIYSLNGMLKWRKVPVRVLKVILSQLSGATGTYQYPARKFIVVKMVASTSELMQTMRESKPLSEDSQRAWSREPRRPIP